jgi:hypothetical protein
VPRNITPHALIRSRFRASRRRSVVTRLGALAVCGAFTSARAEPFIGQFELKTLENAPGRFEFQSQNEWSWAQPRGRSRGRECQVLGWYPHGQKISLDGRLDPANSLYASSIVMHEMVHFLQEQSGRFEESVDCASTLERERESYAVQREFLLRSGAYQPVGASMHAVGCERAHDGDAEVAFKAPSSTSRLTQCFGRTAH